MNLFWTETIINGKIIWIFCIVFTFIFLRSNLVFHSFSSLSSSHRSFITESNKSSLQNTSFKRILVLPIDNILQNLTFLIDQVYHHHGIAYDYYSQNDLNQSKASGYWNVWPLPDELPQHYSPDHIETSPFVISNLPFVDVIYIITDPRLTERHEILKKALLHQGISVEAIKWRTKWNYTTCNSNSSHSYVYQRLNLQDKPLDADQQRKCAVTMEHIDVWYEIAERKIKLGLILEDDAIFVPFFKEKFTRMIYAAMNYGILRLNGTCIKPNDKPISDDEWIKQNPMFVIGTCYKMYAPYFGKYLSNAPPIFSTQKSNPSRCTHAYLLTSCSAQALVDQIHLQKNDFWPSDFMQNHLFRLSSTLQSFWIDPPLSYQGNQVIDLDQIETFKKKTYK